MTRARAVVLVQVKRALGGTGHGSGFVYDASGLILTNHHVVEGATDITVTLPDQRSWPATLVDYHRVVDHTDQGLKTIDAAVLKITASKLSPRTSSSRLCGWAEPSRFGNARADGTPGTSGRCASRADASGPDAGCGSWRASPGRKRPSK